MESLETPQSSRPPYNECSPIFTEYRLMREFVLFQEQNITNVYIVPSKSSAFVWFGVIFIHDQPYQGAILRFKVIIPSDYPCCEVPKVIFDRNPFHALINPNNGQLCTLKHFQNWDPNQNHIWQVIALVKDMFHDVESELVSLSKIISIASKTNSQENRNMKDKDNSLAMTNHIAEQIVSQINVECVQMYSHDFELFQFKIAEVVVESRSKIYDPPECEEDKLDDHAIIFSPFQSDIHEYIRRNVLLSGKSLIDPNSAADQAIFYSKGNDVTIN